MTPSHRVVRGLSISLGLAGILCALNVAPAPPACNWDIIGYVGASYHVVGLRGAELHERTYADVEETCPAELELLTQANEYRRAVAASPDALEAQLPFYRVKALYVAALGGVARTGRSPAAATRWLAALGYLVLAAVVALWLSAHLGAWAAAIGTWLLLSIPSILALGLLATPDSLSVATLLTSAYLLAEQGRQRSALVLALVSIWIRPDNIVWLAVVAAYVALTKPTARWYGLGAMGAGVVSYFVIGAWMDGYGWSAQIQQQFVERTVDPAATPGVGIAQYLGILVRGSHPANQPPVLLIMALIGAATGYLRWRLALQPRALGHLLAVAGLYAALHWLAYPAEDRLVAAAYVIALVIAAITVADLGRRGAPAAS